jgi:transcription elongation factor Elf1
MSRLSDIKISTPVVADIIPSTNTKIKMRAFRVGDEKALMMASESGDAIQMVATLKEVIGNCVDGDFKINDLSSFDIEYLFLKLRSISVGETSDLMFDCKECGHKNKVKVDISNIEVLNQDAKKFVKLNDELGFEMKFSSLEDLVEADGGDADAYIALIARSVKTVYYGEEAIDIGPEEIEDVIRIINELNNKDFSQVVEFINKQPKVVKDIKFVCSECNHENEMRLEGLANFF